MKTKSLLNQWLVAAENVEFEMLTVEGSKKVKIEKGKYYFVSAVIYSGDSSIPVLINYEENSAVYCFVDKKHFNLYV